MRFCPHCNGPLEEEPQLTLAAELPRARTTDSQTAKAAARNNLVRRGNQRWLALRAFMERPMTSEEVAIRVDRKYVAISPRISELRRTGLIEATGLRRVTTSGQEADIHRITDLGREVFRRSLASPKAIDPTEVRRAA